MGCLAFIQMLRQRWQGGQGGQPTQQFPQAPGMHGFQGLLPTYQPPYQPVTHIFQGWQPTQPVQGGLPPQQFVQPQRAGFQLQQHQVDQHMALLQSLHDKFATMEARASQNMGTGPDILRHLDQLSQGELWVMTARRE